MNKTVKQLLGQATQCTNWSVKADDKDDWQLATKHEAKARQAIAEIFQIMQNKGLIESAEGYEGILPPSEVSHEIGKFLKEERIFNHAGLWLIGCGWC